MKTFCTVDENVLYCGSIRFALGRNNDLYLDLMPTCQGNLRVVIPEGRPSEFDQYAEVDLTSCEVVGDGVLVLCDIGDPEVGVDVGDVENVEGVEPEPNVAEITTCACLDVVVFVVQQAIGKSEVETTVGGHAEELALTSHVRRSERQSSSIMTAQEAFPASSAREVVGEEDGGVEQMVGRTWHTHAADGFFGLHQANADP